MKKAKVKIKTQYGELTEKSYLFWTDIDGLKRGDVLVVQTQYGVQIALFEKYSDSEYLPDNFVIGVIKEDELQKRLEKQKSKLLAEFFENFNVIYSHIKKL